MIIGTELIEVETVIAEENHVLNIQFKNGQKKVVDLSDLSHSKAKTKRKHPTSVKLIEEVITEGLAKHRKVA
jgi:hypothetical protein